MPVRAWGTVTAAAGLAAVIAAACGSSRPAARAGAGGGAPAVAAGPARVSSNILRGDYAGSARCAACHADVVAAWQGAPMHLMTRLPEGARVRAPFDGTTFHFKDDTAQLSEKNGARFVALTSPTGGQHLYRVTRVIGGRYREDFAGVEIAAAGGELTSERELILPVSYVFESKSFRLKGYSVLVTERPGLHAGGVWTETCVFCHNTVPYFDDLWGTLYGRGAPGYQGEVVDKLLPPDRQLQFEVAGGGERALVEAVAAEVTAVGGRPAASERRDEVLKHGIHELRARFGARDFVELGIGCEACHGGSRAHADDPRLLPDFAPRGPFLEARPVVPRADGVTRAEWINRACARCHQVLFSRYPFTWEGGQRRGDSPGGSSITSGEGRDFLLGGCARQMSCVTCHDPHGEDRRADLDRLATPAGNGVCVRCHAQYAPPAALAAHAHHDPNGAGGSCVGCHMPRKNMGLGYALTRYHRIGLPDDPVRVERDRPIECALCHADKTVGDLVSTMERWWGRRYDRAALAALYGSLGARPLEATLVRGKAHEQAVALATLGAAQVTAAAPAVARQLVNPFPLVRYYARRALEALRGEACAVDLDRPTPEIAAAVRACVPDAFEAGALPGAAPPAREHDVPDED
ncbi:MAG TPA: cytochrome c3 family protein [Polyangia bacterium]|nr:cytochrome c3 family protein [Polyangia bacterium]